MALCRLRFGMEFVCTTILLSTTISVLAQSSEDFNQSGKLIKQLKCLVDMLEIRPDLIHMEIVKVCGFFWRRLSTTRYLPYIVCSGREFAAAVCSYPRKCRLFASVGRFQASVCVIPLPEKGLDKSSLSVSQCRGIHSSWLGPVGDVHTQINPG